MILSSVTDIRKRIMNNMTYKKINGKFVKIKEDRKNTNLEKFIKEEDKNNS